MDNIEICQQCSAADSTVCDSLPHLCGRCERTEAAEVDAE